MREEEKYMISFDEYIKKFNLFMTKYFPSKEEWTPSDDALYKPKNLFRIPLKEADRLKFKAIKYIFKHHYDKNKFYRSYCKENKVKPEDIKSIDDFDKIPLVPDKFFKDYPHGKEFALWLSGLFTNDIPNIVINKKKPSFDDVINDFNAAGLMVSYSSGTSGRHTFIPRDKRTFYASEYALAKCVVTMAYPIWKPELNGYLLMPNPFKTNLYAGKVTMVYFDLIKNIEVAIDREISTEIIRATMSGERSLRAALVRWGAKREHEKMIQRIIRWLIEMEKKKEGITFVGAPYILYFVMERLKEKGLTFNFGENSGVITGGGWKIHEDKKISVEEFRKQVKETLGIPEENCLDAYGMVEGNGWMVHCREGHYLHVPYSYFHPLVLDRELKPVGYGEWGRFAFLDSAAHSYPGFIISGDQVRLLEHCPVCDRPGPVLEPEIKRAKGEEVRGCAEELRRMIASDVR
ncbi:MAG: hypothetical protein DRJ99_03695 [Thermoplasmata archaeon]|nr:MAG: hypothetical protein DRJ99_03695 [Thermoplasmata archaeon]